jgi:hypothetical protein
MLRQSLSAHSNSDLPRIIDDHFYSLESREWGAKLCFEIACGDLHVPLSLLPLRKVARLGKGNPLDLGDAIEEGLDDGVGRLVVAAVDEQRRDGDGVELVNNAPVAEGANDVEFGRAIPGCQM